MRRAAAALVLLAAVPVAADTVVLKSGARLVAEKVVEEGDRVILIDDGGRSKMSLAKSSVERVERDGAKPPRRERRDARPASAATPAPTPEPPVSATPSAQKGEAAVLLEQAASLMERQKFREAEESLRFASTLAPESAAVWRALGSAQYAMNHVERAIESWKESLRLSPDPQVARWLQKAERESAAEEGYLEGTTPNFTLRYEGKKVAPRLRRALLDMLETEWVELSRQLETAPAEPVVVILYTNQVFYDVTRAPGWSGALYDGKVRLPVDGLEEATPELKAVTKHELAHSFIHARSRGRCPTWLNEGLAQLLEGRTSPGIGRGVRLANLEGPFSGLDPVAAGRAYSVSLAAVQLLRDRYGLSEVGRLLDRLADGESMEGALRSSLRLTYRDLDEQVAYWLEGRMPKMGDIELSR